MVWQALRDERCPDERNGRPEMVKKRRWITMPLNRLAVQIVEEAMTAHDSEYLFPGDDNEPVTDNTLGEISLRAPPDGGDADRQARPYRRRHQGAS